MKWTKPGREFDKVYDEIKGKKYFYLFGAGDYGKQFYATMKNEIEILGFIDNNSNKQNEKICGIDCIDLGQLNINRQSFGIIITVSQIQRGAIIDQLQKYGYLHNKDFFLIEDFLSIYFVYKYNKVYFSSISFLPSTACNLNCEACLNFNPYASKFYVREWEAVKKDIDLFFKCIDYVMLFHVSGGEPMLYKNIAKVIEYIDSSYREKIGTLRTVTNGTIIPSDETLERLSKCDFEMTVDDYRDAVPQYSEKFDRLIEKLKQYNIHYYINKTDEWIDLAPNKTDFSDWSEEKLQQHFNECCQSWQELREGKIYTCNYDAYATVAGINVESVDGCFNLKSFCKNKSKELIEFRLGFSKKGYVEFCKKCRGFSTKNMFKVSPAKQAEKV